MMICSATSAENTSSCGMPRRSITSDAAGGDFRHHRRHDGIDSVCAAHAAVSAVSASAQRTRITPAHRPNMSRRYEVYTEVSQLFNTPLFIPQPQDFRYAYNDFCRMQTDCKGKQRRSTPTFPWCCAAALYMVLPIRRDTKYVSCAPPYSYTRRKLAVTQEQPQAETSAVTQGHSGFFVIFAN